MSLKERAEHHKRRSMDFIATLTEKQFLDWREFRNVMLSSDLDMVAFRFEVRAEHKRLAKLRSMIMERTQRRRFTIRTRP